MRDTLCHLWIYNCVQSTEEGIPGCDMFCFIDKDQWGNLETGGSGVSHDGPKCSHFHVDVLGNLAKLYIGAHPSPSPRVGAPWRILDPPLTGTTFSPIKPPVQFSDTAKMQPHQPHQL